MSTFTSSSSSGGGFSLYGRLRNLLLRLWNYLLSLWSIWFGPILTLDSGIQVRIGHKIAEGGFSIIYQATEVRNNNNNNNNDNKNYRQRRLYALKRIRCDDLETRTGCIYEGKVHLELMRSRGMTTTTSMMIDNNAGSSSSSSSSVLYTMPLLGMSFCENNTICYMLFPYLPHSLRKEVNQRIFVPLQAVLDDNKTNNNNNNNNNINNRRRPLSESQKVQRVKDVLKIPPWSESVVLQLFGHLCEGVSHIHTAGYSHRDIKLENVLLMGSNPTHLVQPVLMDFGSAGPLTQSLTSRKDVLQVADVASTHTTLSYRPPELFAGELRTTTTTTTTMSSGNNNNTDTDSILDYSKVDVWMLGCTLFAILFGTSPGECEFSTTTGQIRIVPATHNKILSPIPFPPADTPPSQWYSKQILELISWMCTQDRHVRPTLTQVQQRVDQLMMNNNGSRGGGGTNIHNNDSTGMDQYDHDNMDDIESQQIDISFATKNIL